MDYMFLPKNDQVNVLTDRMKQLERAHLERSQIVSYFKKRLAVAKTKEEKESAKTQLADGEKELADLDLAYAETMLSYKELKPGPPPSA